MAGDQFLVVEDATEAREIAQRRERLDREAKSRRTAKSVVYARRLHGAAGGRREAHAAHRSSRPTRAVRRKRSPTRLAQLSQRRSHGRSHPPRRRRDHRERHSARARGRRDHHRLPRAAGQQRARGGRARRRRHQAVQDHLRGGRTTFAPRSRACCVPRSARSCSARPRCARLFKVPKIGVDRRLLRAQRRDQSPGSRIRVIRDGVEVYDGTIGSLRRFKDDVKEVREGFECGIGIENFNDIKVGDVIECYRKEEVARTLTSTWQLRNTAPRGSRRGGDPRRGSDVPRRGREGSAHRRLRHRHGRRGHARPSAREGVRERPGQRRGKARDVRGTRQRRLAPALARRTGAPAARRAGDSVQGGRQHCSRGAHRVAAR